MVQKKTEEEEEEKEEESLGELYSGSVIVLISSVLIIVNSLTAGDETRKEGSGEDLDAV